MTYSAHRAIFAVFGLVALLLAIPTMPLGAQKGIPPMLPQPRPSPNTPDGNVPSGLKGPAVTGPDEKSLDLQNQAEVRADIERLYALAFELREQMKVTNGANTLSLELVKKAQAIEKLAKEIKNRSKR
jgi:hypothetical protein